MVRHFENTAPCGRLVLAAPLAAVLLAVCFWAGCSTGGNAYQDGQEAAQRELWDRAVLAYAKAVAEDPANDKYRMALQRAKLRASTVHFDRAKRYLETGAIEQALKELQEATLLDPTNEYAQVELNRVRAEVERRRTAPSPMERAQSAADQQAAQLAPPKLDPTSNIPIVLKIPDSTVGEVYETLSKTSGINFMYDEKVDLKKKTSIDVANVTFEQAMEILMLMNKHFYKVIDGHTILVADDNRQKHTEYDDQVIRTFYLSNAETQEISQLVRQLLETRRIAENKNLNAITIKDTPEKVKVAERIIKANDKAKGEVLVDIELLELDRTKLQKLGIDLTTKSLLLAFGGSDDKGAVKSLFVPFNQLDQIKQASNWFLGPIPGIVLDFLRSDTDSKAIARPQVRILEGDTGKITIGDRVPIPATSFNTSQTVGGSIVPVTSFQYQNVGIIVEVKPRVHHNKEVTLDIKAEISAVTGNVDAGGGLKQPIIGTRTVETTIRLQDGETNLLAGLIKEAERKSMSGLPGVEDIPVVRRLFGSDQHEVETSDIVLSITPHIVRVPNVEPIDLVPLWVGTEEKIELRGVAKNALGESPFGPGPSPWDSIEKELKGEKTAGVSQTGAGKEGAKESGAKPPATVKPGAKVAAGAAAGAAARPQASPPVSPAPAPALPTPGSESAAPAPPAETAPPAPGGAAFEEKPPLTVAQIRLAPERGQVAAGEGVAVDVLVGEAVGVGVVNFQLRYDPSVLQFVPPATSGEFLQQGGAPVDLQAVESADGGLIVVSASRGGGAGASGSGRLLRLNFVALSEGSAAFSFSAAQVRGPDDQALPVSLRVSDIRVTP